MTDLEMTKRCAEALGYEYVIQGEHVELTKKGRFAVPPWVVYRYVPLHDDAQAMALVKRFRLFINSADEEAYWKVAPHGQGVTDCHSDLNRAIVECVAKMQASVSPPDNAEAKST